MQLPELQNAFQAYLMHGDSASISTNIAPIANGNVAARLNIYHHAYRARIREALSSPFPNLKKLLGKQLFEQHADKFIAQHPSTYRNMRWLGEKLSAYLQQTAPDKPIYADMAKFEWQLGLAFDAADTLVISLQDLAAIAPELWGQLTFQWHPSVYLGSAQTNVIEVWKALDSESNAYFTVSKKPLKYLIWRKNLVSQFKSVSDTEASAIAFMLQNHSFGELCEFLASELSEDAAIAHAAGLLSDWLQQEMLIGLNVEVAKSS